MIGMSDMQHSGSYGTNWFSKSCTHDPLVENNIYVALSVEHTSLHYSVEQTNDRTTNKRTCE